MEDRKAKYEATRKQVNFRLSLDDFDKLVEKVEKSDMTISEFCRHAVLKKKAKNNFLTKADTAKILANHGKIGSNINQLSKAVHQGKLNLTSEDKKILNALVKAESDIIAVLMGEKIQNKSAAMGTIAPICPTCNQKLAQKYGKNGVLYFYCENKSCMKV